MKLTPEEILEGNKLIAQFMGDYFDTGLEPSYYIRYNQEYKLEDSQFHSSWDWIMPVVDKINGMGKAYSFAIFKTYVSLTVEKGGKVFKDYSFAFSEYITTEQTGKQAAFKLIVKFVKWENENKLKSELSFPL
jgi:hypothetical protein